MSEEDYSNALLTFVKAFPETGDIPEKIEDLKFPKPLFLLYEFLTGDDIQAKDLTEGTGSTAWLQTHKALKALLEKLYPLVKDWTEVKVDSLSVVRRGDQQNIQNFIILLLILGVHCAKKDEVINRIKKLPSPTPKQLMGVLKKYSITPKEHKTPTKAEPEKSPVKEEPKQETPTKPRAKPAEPQATQDNSQDDEKIKLLNSQNENLSNEIEKIKQQIEQAKKDKEAAASNTNTGIQEIASMKADLFSIQTQNKANQQKLQKRKDKKALMAKLEADRDALKKQVDEAEKSSENSNSKEKIIEQLNKRLQEIRLDPRNDRIDQIKEDLKKYESLVKKLYKAEESLKNRIIGQQSLSALQERLQFLKALEQTNIDRLKRAKLNLALSMKTLRCESFQKEMRAII
ncbi:hypothetical protein TVAG_286270 [Trichomonas vaginalis G3]|uniref:Uncharacterized protein n=1 Tax=Trichomonas vaginalis (strain ATCC PRA-98 / G3) TaxID=412133 RepID=A2EPE1_TRIV3|nr:hook domain family [Trichomonas vaginalis G3]EAY05449.1 hypothetical protein TVAG_286270 [Trichomonas vaginalis G3]KAI5503573.1 hook domain family [Trichomonas vaginalis G3]|eukprot:XP_001317672.1 hypothetical protein [Trichomonas vaginalis G3]